MAKNFIESGMRIVNGLHFAFFCENRRLCAQAWTHQETVLALTVLLDSIPESGEGEWSRYPYGATWKWCGKNVRIQVSLEYLNQWILTVKHNGKTLIETKYLG